MHRSEAETLEICVDCDAEIADVERGFAVDDERYLCFACAVKRGGKYDETHDHWDPPPSLEGLPSHT
jgi:hypothetical protein